MLLNKRLQYLHNLLQNFKLKMLPMVKQDMCFFQYTSGDLVYIISPLTIQLRTSSRRVAIQYIGPLIIYKLYTHTITYT